MRIRKSPGVTGIKIKDMEYLITQFADDTSIYLDGRRGSFENESEFWMNLLFGLA